MSKLTFTSEVTHDTDNRTLNVDDHGRSISVPKEPDMTKLVWILTRVGNNGAFNAIDLSEPLSSGFSWIGREDGSSPPGFKVPRLAAEGKHVILEDLNNDNASAGGPYVYQLRALIDGASYSTISTVLPRGTVVDPSIMNE